MKQILTALVLGIMVTSCNEVGFSGKKKTQEAPAPETICQNDPSSCVTTPPQPEDPDKCSDEGVQGAAQSASQNASQSDVDSSTCLKDDNDKEFY